MDYFIIVSFFLNLNIGIKDEEDDAKFIMTIK